MRALIERLTGTAWQHQRPAFVIGMGHGATHWIIASFYVLLPYLSKELGLSYTEAGSLITLFHASAFAANVGSGAIVDIVGRHVQIQAASLVVGAAALAIAGFADGMAWLIIAVVLIGTTNNLWHPAAISYLSQTYPNRRGFALSIHTLGASLGDILAPLAAGTLLLVMTWHGTASLSALPVFGVAALIIILLRGSRTESAGPRPHASFNDYLSGLIGLVRDRAMMGLCVMAGFRSMTQNGLLVFLPLYLAGHLQVSLVVVGLVVMSLQIGGIFGGPIAGAWSDRTNRRSVVLVGLIPSMFLVAGLSFTDGVVQLVLLVSLLGFALFAVRPVIHSWAMDLAADDMSGSAVSILFGVQSGFTVLVPVAGGLIADRWGLPAVFYLLTVTIVISTIIVFFLPDARKPVKDLSR